MLSRPQPWVWAKNAIPTAANGNSRRTTNVFSTTRPRLFDQRRRRPMDCGRRGVSSSHTAIGGHEHAGTKQLQHCIGIEASGHGLNPCYVLT